MFDTNIDEETPPPPGNFMYAWFGFEEIKLRKDYRNAFTDEITWTLKYLPGESESLAIEWAFTEENFTGSVMLTDPEETFAVDMMEESSANINIEQVDELKIVYSYESYIE